MNTSAKPASADAPRAAGAFARSATAYPAAVDRLIGEFAKLPGIGRRSAERLALFVLKSTTDEAMALSKAVHDVKAQVRYCTVCYNLADVPGAGGVGGGAALCGVCRAEGREREKVLVVEQPRDVLALETTGLWRGVYHVLLGRISPLEGVGAGDLTVAALLERVDQPQRNHGVAITEVILGLNPTLESDGTGLYLAEQLGTRGGGVKVSRLARGLPTGSSLEFVSKAVLADAITGRQSM